MGAAGSGRQFLRNHGDKYYLQLKGPTNEEEKECTETIIFQLARQMRPDAPNPMAMMMGGGAGQYWFS